MTDTAVWYPPLVIDEIDGPLISKTLSVYDNVFEMLGRAEIIRAIASAPEVYNFSVMASSAKEEDDLILTSMKLLEPVSLLMFEEIFARCREHSKYFPEEWMLKKERDAVVGRHIEIYQRLAMLDRVVEHPSEDDTITREWFYAIRSKARRNHGANYRAFINWIAPDNGSFPET